MQLTIGPRDLLQIDDAKICYRNFRGEAGMYNDEGDRSFSLIIPNQEIADMLMENKNRYDVGWNVKISQPREEGAMPFMHLPVKVKFNDRGPKVYLISGNNKRLLQEDKIEMLDYIDIRSVDMDIAPHDGEARFGAFRKAYLRAIYVTQEVDRFAARFAEEEYPEE